MYLKMYKKYGAVLSSLFLAAQSINAQTDSLFLTIDQLFERGVQHSLQLQADVMKESMAQERIRTARSAQLPELQIGLKGGFVGQPVVWERGLSDPSYPEAPDWSQNYAIDLAQPLYQGGKIRSAIHKADIEKQVAELQTLTDEAEIKLRFCCGCGGMTRAEPSMVMNARRIKRSSPNGTLESSCIPSPGCPGTLYRTATMGRP